MERLPSTWRFYSARQSTDLPAKAVALQPELILLSAHQLDLHGFDACVRLRRSPFLRQIPLVLAMRCGDGEFHAVARQIGCSHVLELPLGAARLVEELSVLLGDRFSAARWPSAFSMFPPWRPAVYQSRS
jgi:CheY-like chemotaxis protein